MAVAAPPPGPDPSAQPACDCASRPAYERDLLLSVVLEHEPRRRLRALDAEWTHAAPGRRVAVLSAARRVLERRPADAADADARDRVDRGRRGRQLVVGAGIA